MQIGMTIDALKIGHFDNKQGLVITKDWPYHPERIGEPCKSCKILNHCGGGCRGTAILENLTRTGELDVYAGFENCPVNLGIEFPETFKTLARTALSFIKHRGMLPRQHH